MHDLLLYDFNLCYNLMKKLLLERAIAYKIFLKDQKILKNQMVHYLEIIETKQNIYDETINNGLHSKE